MIGPRGNLIEAKGTLALRGQVRATGRVDTEPASHWPAVAPTGMLLVPVSLGLTPHHPPRGREGHGTRGEVPALDELSPTLLTLLAAAEPKSIPRPHLPARTRPVPTCSFGWCEGQMRGRL